MYPLSHTPKSAIKMVVVCTIEVKTFLNYAFQYDRHIIIEDILNS